MANSSFITQFLTNPETTLDDLTLQDIKRRSEYPNADILNEEINSFIRIYYSSEGYDLGTAPMFTGDGNLTCEKDCFRQIVLGLRPNNQSLEERAHLVHNIWAHNYLIWRSQGVIRGRDYLLVPFENLPPFERKKRYFVAELVTLISLFTLTSSSASYCASLAMDVATYRVAFELLQSVIPNCDDPEQLIEYSDRNYNSPSTLH